MDGKDQPRAGFPRLIRIAASLGLVATAAGVGVAGALVAYAFLAPLDPLDERAPVAGTLMVDRHGTLLARDSSEGIRVPVALEQIAPLAVAATIAAEDQRFWHHFGVDPLAVASALGESLTDAGRPRGASTITQQVARQLYLDDGSPALLRKAREALTAFQLEARYPKSALVEAYLNHVYYGRGAYGIEAAARVYFGVSARNLDLARASYLAGLPQLPGIYGEAADAGGALARQQYVLERLVATGAITGAQADEAAAATLGFVATVEPELAPHFTRMVEDELAAIRPDLAGRPGLVVETTLDATLQREANRSVAAHLGRVADRNAGNGAVVALDANSGAVVVLVGSADFAEEEAGQVNMAVALRQPGSALKPFLYGAAFEQGYTAATPLLDVPSSFATADGAFRPINYDHRFRGPTPLRTALASSLNVPAVRTLDDLGIEAFLEVAHRFGLRDFGAAEAYGLAVVLGAAEVRLLDLTAAYGALAAGGLRAEPYTIERVRVAATGEVLYEREAPVRERAIAAEHAFLLADILSDPFARAPAFGFHTALDTPFPAAVKTGTTSQFRDSWAVGFTPEHAVGVWVGNADGEPMIDLPGLEGAAPIWRDVMVAVSADRPERDFVPPPSMVSVTVCQPTGLLPGPHCPSPAGEWFIAGTEPGTTETYYLRDAGGRLVIDPPVEARAWAADAGLRLAGVADGAAGTGLTIVQPARGAVLFLAPELPAQEAVLRVSAPAAAERIEFLIDGELVGRASGPDARLLWELTPGVHTLRVVAVLASGGTETATTRFEVREQ